MLLSVEITCKLNSEQANYIGHMNYAAYKLWNACNYERKNWKALGLPRFPDWYAQKASHKDDLWFKNLPSQTAQEVCKVLDKAWKSYFALLSSHGIANPRPPRFKSEGIRITYMQNGMRHDGDIIRLTLSKHLKEHMKQNYGLDCKFLYLKHDSFKRFSNIKQLHVYPPENGVSRMIVVYEIPDIGMLPDNGHYLAIDLGIRNPLTCLDSIGCDSFIVGRGFAALCRKYDKEIGRVQGVWYEKQAARGVKHPATSGHIQQLYVQRRDAVSNFLHQMTAYVAAYCTKHHVCAVIIGDITGIRNGFDKGHILNGKMHSFPYARIMAMLEYKLRMHGIRLIRINEAYSSSCSPLSPSVGKEHAKPAQRKFRGLYVENGKVWNADSVGAYNILRLYLQKTGRPDRIAGEMSANGLSSPKIVRLIPYKEKYRRSRKAAVGACEPPAIRR